MGILRLYNTTSNTDACTLGLDLGATHNTTHPHYFCHTTPNNENS